MATTINVNKQSVKDLLGSGTKNPFVIPEYQRPYAWTEDEITTLFEDLWEFATTSGGTNNDGTYFLGCVVSYENEDKEQEIIDGQQRITSLFLLLRAIYTKLMEADEKTDMAKNFISQIEPAIWRKDKLTGHVDYSSTLLMSRVVNNEGNEILRKILETGEAAGSATDNYSKNYKTLQKLYELHSKDNPLMIYQFIYAVLNQSILLPITADSQNTALIIFNTLNARGLPLSDADIFKAKMYNNLNDEEKKSFIESWKSLDENAAHASESIQSLFYYYMFYLRALENDRNTTTPGIRKFYSANKYYRLYEPELLDNLTTILNLWKVINTHETIDGETWSTNFNILQTLDILTSYPNEFWKYPVVIYYLRHRTNERFEDDFLLFLHKLTTELLSKYCLIPTINAVKTDILKLNAEIIKDSHPLFDFKDIDNEELSNRIKAPHRNAVRMLLKVLAYANQNELLPERWEIEHIFPQKWQVAYFPDVPAEVIQEKIEHIGNKLPFEKRLNIIAGNGYFSKKKNEYRQSNIEITKQIGEISSNDWTLDNITERDLKVSERIFEILANWNNQYQIESSSDEQQPSAEQLKQIELFKQNGWI